MKTGYVVPFSLIFLSFYILPQFPLPLLYLPSHLPHFSSPVHTSERVRLSLGVNTVWHTKLRQDETPSLCIQDEQGSQFMHLVKALFPMPHTPQKIKPHSVTHIQEAYVCPMQVPLLSVHSP